MTGVADKVPLLVADIAQDLADLRDHGRMRRADTLAVQSGEHFNATTRPQYFTGDLAGRFVLVHLNPKQRDDHSPRSTGELPFAGVQEYLDWHTSFGSRHYGVNSPRSHRSPFDLKQIRFLRPFGDIEFVDEMNPGDRFENLERVIDRKLQLELVPYGSDVFRPAPFVRNPSLLQPHFDRLLETIAASPRRHVVFCGAVFEPLLRGFQVGPTQVFKLRKRDGSWTRGRYRFARLAIEHRGTTIAAGLAHSYASQGLPAEEYGAEVSSRY